MSKKKFKDTAVGKFLTSKVPGALGVIGDVLPDQGVFGIAKNLIGSNKLNPAEKAEAMRLLIEEEEMYMRDRSNARQREVDLAKAGKMDWMMKVVGLTVLGLFAFAMVSVFFFSFINGELAHFMLGELSTMVVGIVAYYYGTSKSSSDKTKMLTK